MNIIWIKAGFTFHHQVIGPSAQRTAPWEHMPTDKMQANSENLFIDLITHVLQRAINVVITQNKLTFSRLHNFKSQKELNMSSSTSLYIMRSNVLLQEI